MVSLCNFCPCMFLLSNLYSLILIFKIGLLLSIKWTLLLFLSIVLVTPSLARRRSDNNMQPTDTTFAQRIKKAKAEDFTMSAQQLHGTLNELTNHYSYIIEGHADSIVANAQNPLYKHNATQWKLTAIPTIFRSLFNTRPLVGLIDAWAYSIQMKNYFESDVGQKAFGPWASTGVSAAEILRSEIEQLAVSLPKNGDIKRVKAMVSQWAYEHPISSFVSHRQSMILHLTQGETSLELSTFQSLGKLTTQLDDIIAQFTTYGAYLPKGMQWQSELILTKIAKSSVMDSVLSEIDTLTNDIHSITAVAKRTPTLIAMERTIAIEAIKNERKIVLEFAQQERSLVLAALAEERATIFAAIDSMRITTTNDAQAIAINTIDHLLIQLTKMLVVLAGLAILIILVVKLVPSQRSNN